MDNTVIATICFLHIMFGTVLGRVLSRMLDIVLVSRLEKQLQKAVDNMFHKDLQLDRLEDEVKKLTCELEYLKAKFPVVDLPTDNDGYVSDSSTELGSMD